MPKTLLAVDDSATMRKVLEITFTGEDFKVLLAESGQAAAKVGESPSAIVVDTVLEAGLRGVGDEAVEPGIGHA